MSQQQYISVPMLKKAGACYGYQETLGELFGKQRKIPFTMNLARFIVDVLGRDSWVADYMMTRAASNKFYERKRKLQRVLTNSDGTERVNPNYNYEVATALQATYRPRKELL